MKHRTIATVLFSVIAAALPTAPVRADMAPLWPAAGGAIQAPQPTQVRMDSERVVLRYENPAERTAIDGSIIKLNYRLAVTAVFTFVNQGAKDESLLIGFPLTDPKLDGYEISPDQISFFADGKKLQTRTQLLPEGDEGSVWKPPFSKLVPPFAGTSVWAATELTFPANKTVVVRVEYSQDSASYQGTPELSHFYYVLHTGAPWAGTIGRAEIVLEMPYPVERLNVPLTTLPNAKYGGNTASWVFTNLEPGFKDDFRFDVMTPAFFAELAALRERVLADKTNAGLRVAYGDLLMRAFPCGSYAGCGKAYVSDLILAEYKRASDLAPKMIPAYIGQARLYLHEADTQKGFYECRSPAQIANFRFAMAAVDKAMKVNAQAPAIAEFLKSFVLYEPKGACLPLFRRLVKKYGLPIEPVTN